MNSTQYFTVEDANQRLPLVRAIVRDIVDLYADVHERRERMVRLRRRPEMSKAENAEDIYQEEVAQAEQQLKNDIDRLDEYCAELNALGVELKDPVEGLVDFRSRYEGRDVYLCWKLGEDEIAHWHELDAGVAGRQSLLQGSTFGGPESSDEEKPTI